MARNLPFLVAFICALAFIAACAPVDQEPLPRACTEEAKLCPGGEAVGREGPNCEFPECPEVQSCRGPADEPVPCQDGYTCYAFGRGGMCFMSQEGACQYFCNSFVCDTTGDNRVICLDG